MDERIVEIGTQEHTKVICLDEPTHGGACHEYRVEPTEFKTHKTTLAEASFQKGPVKENGVNGCHNEDLIAIVIDRMQHFQAGEYSCRENAIALTKLEEALMWLRKRTTEREQRGVEGTSTK